MNLSIWFKRFVFSSAIAACVLALGTQAPGQQPAPRGPGRQSPGSNDMFLPPVPGEPGARMGAGRELRLGQLLERPEIQKALQITDDQLKKLEDIAFSSRKQAIQQRAALQVQQLELRRMMRADNPDRAGIDKKIQEVSQARAALTRTEMAALLDIRTVLTKEQRDRIGEIVSTRIWQRRQGRPPGPRPQEPPQPPQPPEQQR